ncbi:Endonuclease [Rubrivivax sp. A210]|uniref:H-NS histone family protein n=1 Tax=Rubrivivax sp. A210 TaxID=2772301 RepID=UPI0019191990|nr:H-NS histone family protein [Rubrivivax sp. A210]CAD5370301.1 Endonuclease [Rubrivivax sp. A210]
MTKSYEQILKQIDALKIEAEKLRRKEVDGVISRIREAIDFYGLTSADLGLGNAKGAAKAEGKAAKAPKASKAGKAPPVVKFRNETGGTWGGIGKRPQWLRDALAAGKTLADFAVK